jgi:hypothetical protein
MLESNSFMSVYGIADTEQGGYGWLSGRYGLSIDCLLSVRMVLADGSHVTASEKENPDLFWAVRGAGQAFGVVIEFVFQGFEQKNNVWAGLLAFTPDKLPQIVDFANKLHEVGNGDQAMLMAFSAPPPEYKITLLMVVFYNGPKDDAEAFFGDVLALGPLMNITSEMPYEKVNSLLNPMASYGGRKIFGGGHFQMPLKLSYAQNIMDTLNDFIEKNENTNESVVMFEFFPFQNKMLKVPMEATAFANRGTYYNIGTNMVWKDQKQDEECKKFSKYLTRVINEGGLDQSKIGTKEEGVGVYANYLSELFFLLLSYNYANLTRLR